ncbi:MAG: tRNA (N6-isopentenyl adenosine(37)-C2)-methylthiotransferase MiaB [Clostridia bacterium]|nr:tRNA (N6-isopentenyl adenosine(37)-C2)-methylthiotransferase MiaB [Clostridia bacterium]
MGERLEFMKTEMEKQNKFLSLAKSLLEFRFGNSAPKAYVHTFGCQGNVSDGERMKGLLSDMGYMFVDDEKEADLILLNTCAIREHAEDRVYGNIGRLKILKKQNPDLIICICGCMVQQKHVEEKIRKSYPYVTVVFGTHVIHKLPEFVYRALTTGKRVYDTDNTNLEIAEGNNVWRDGKIRAWLPIMYGCNNFCSYCVVPYVRGRERSRKSEEILKEAKHLVSLGFKDITLLGQNVNSYGKGLEEDINFAKLLRMINDIDGDFTIRFMTSHPKDCTAELLDAMAECDKVAKHLHLPVQSGNDRILKEMNRHYDRAKYLSLIEYARKVMPDLSITSDIIVGFPGETYEEFCDTLSLVEKVEYTSLYTFIYSARKNTKAAEMPDPITREEKGKWFDELLKLQEKIAAQRTAKMNGRVYKVLAEEKSKTEGWISGRTSGNVIIEFPADESVIGSFCEVIVNEPLNWIVKGEFVRKF